MKKLCLFGGDKDWDEDDWVGVDDRVRGGKSESHLSCDSGIASFHGILDITTLGGAGFASQRTATDDLELNLSDYAGIQLCIAKGDKNRYTLNLKDEILQPDPDTGREQATISWECDFVVPPEGEPDESYDKSIFIPWSALTPTYRGKPKKDVKDLDLENIKRLSIMIRSFFGVQEGDFSLSIQSISALCETPPSTVQRPGFSKNFNIRHLEDGTATSAQESNLSSWTKFRNLVRGHRGVAYTVIGLTAALILYSRCRSGGLLS